MKNSASAVIAWLTLALLGSVTASAQGTVVVGVPAQAGAVDGTHENSDAFIWRLFTEFAAPASESRPSPVVLKPGPRTRILFRLSLIGLAPTSRGNCMRACSQQ